MMSQKWNSAFQAKPPSHRACFHLYHWNEVTQIHRSSPIYHPKQSYKHSSSGLGAIWDQSQWYWEWSPHTEFLFHSSLRHHYILHINTLQTLIYWDLATAIAKNTSTVDHLQTVQARQAYQYFVVPMGGGKTCNGVKILIISKMINITLLVMNILSFHFLQRRGRRDITKMNVSQSIAGMSAGHRW